ncbi:hypothetical protein [Streptomyces sp. NPDC092370]|uniref:hypothetical protein n=1 Tax=Streptomyces sp. NPDC092370 TaxID=3366016 RepID=UPI0038053E89
MSAVVTLPGAFPGGTRITGVTGVTGIADEKCYALQGQYARDTWAMPTDVGAYSLMPSRDGRRYGDRAITRLFGGTGAAAEPTGSLAAAPPPSTPIRSSSCRRSTFDGRRRRPRRGAL